MTIRKTHHLILCVLLGSIVSMACRSESVDAYKTIGFIESLSQEFDDIVDPDTKIEVIATEHNWTEGPVWIPSENCLLYSDVPENKVFKWTEEKGVEQYLDPSGYSGKEKGRPGSNGLVLNSQGDLILCRSGDREVAMMKSTLSDPMPVFHTIANRFEQQKFNSPNDVIVDSKDNFYFTDPNFGLRDTTLKETKFQGVYKIGKTGTVQLLTKNCPEPNGIGLSPDERTLYVANSRPPKLFAYDLSESGLTSNERVLFDATMIYESSISRQPPDGMSINKDGIIFMTGPDGVLVIDQEGNHLGTIRTDKLTSNCTFDDTESTLFVTCDDLVLRVRL